MGSRRLYSFIHLSFICKDFLSLNVPNIYRSRENKNKIKYLYYAPGSTITNSWPILFHFILLSQLFSQFSRLF